ncbi:SA1362 family protein [Alkalibacillus aidingensis]|uniref:SA1362 family protein n=1 Tax=Alkalibacillus aidingensis TaxID=2747607 RepID=UPI00166164C6|nr:SA1362 family protein [Alkalibacillus aidingensis]
MPRSKNAIIIYIVGSLALIGIFGQLFNSPIEFIQGILMMLGFTALIGAAVYYFLIYRGRSPKSGYHQAVKQSKQKYGTTNHHMGYQSQVRKPSKLSKRNHVQKSHLKVIRGNKK